ncbi:unnamed protein product, partial [Cyprideis torosa]
MRGYGDSDKPKEIANYHIDKLVEDLKLLPSALGRSKIDVLLAHDWGGVIGWIFVARFPEMVGRFVPMNCVHPQAFQEHIRSKWSQFKKSWYVFFFQMPWVPEWWMKLEDFKWLTNGFTNPRTQELVISEEDLNVYKYVNSKPVRVHTPSSPVPSSGALTYPINYYRALDLLGNKGKKLARIQVPTCLVFGTGDSYLESTMVDRTAQFCDKFEVHKLDGISHWIQQEAPESVNEIVRKFLSRSLFVETNVCHYRGRSGIYNR